MPRASPRMARSILLADQDRTRWDRARIAEASALLARATASGRVGSFSIQAAIAETHAAAADPGLTDWPTIVGLYDLLVRLDPSAVVRLNRAVAVAMRDGPEAGLTLIDSLLADGELSDYHHARSAQADLLRRLDRRIEAQEAYRQALSRTEQEPERRFLERRHPGARDLRPKRDTLRRCPSQRSNRQIPIRRTQPTQTPGPARAG